MDRLEEMFDRQRAFQERLARKDGDSYPPADPTALTSSIAMTAYALCDEVHEATDEIGWKPWASSRHVNRPAYLGELVDAWHFFMNMCLLAGITPDELYAGYMQKIQVNHDRQDNGYDGVSSKCPACHRAHDDPSVHCHPENQGKPAWCEVYGYVDKQGHAAWDQATLSMPVIEPRT